MADIALFSSVMYFRCLELAEFACDEHSPEVLRSAPKPLFTPGYVRLLGFHDAL